MKKGPSFEMDMEEWELLPDEGLFSGKAAKDLDYYICPDDPYNLLESVDDLTMTKSDRKQSAVNDPIKRNQAALRVFPDEEELVKEVIKEINVVPSPPAPVVVEEDDPVVKSDARRDEPKEQKFADITNDAGKTRHVASVDVGSEDVKREQDEEKKCVCSAERGRGCWDGFSFSIWRWRLTGIGTLCSIGMAAATICMFILGGHQRQKNLQQNQKVQFQIQPEEKNLKQVVQHATRLNQAMSAVRGVPVPRASISFGGYYDGI